MKAEIWYGGYTGPAQKIAEDTVVVDNIGAPQRYTFDFGTRTWYLTLQAVWLVISYQGDVGDTVIYWDSVDTPTCLHLQGTLAVKESTWGSVKELFQ